MSFSTTPEDREKYKVIDEIISDLKKSDRRWQIVCLTLAAAMIFLMIGLALCLLNCNY